jgi:hypothetical protein
MENSAPPDRLSPTVIDPPWLMTIRRLKLNPMPVPSGFVV